MASIPKDLEKQEESGNKLYGVGLKL